MINGTLKDMVNGLEECERQADTLLATLRGIVEALERLDARLPVVGEKLGELWNAVYPGDR